MQLELRVYRANISWSSRRLEDMSSEQKCLLEISVSNHGLLINLNQYLTNLYLINLCHESKANPKCINSNQIISILETQSADCVDIAEQVRQ